MHKSCASIASRLRRFDENLVNCFRAVIGFGLARFRPRKPHNIHRLVDRHGRPVRSSARHLVRRDVAKNTEYRGRGMDINQRVRRSSTPRYLVGTEDGPSLAGHLDGPHDKWSSALRDLGLRQRQPGRQILRRASKEHRHKASLWLVARRPLQRRLVAPKFPSKRSQAVTRLSVLRRIAPIRASQKKKAGGLNQHTGLTVFRKEKFTKLAAYPAFSSV